MIDTALRWFAAMFCIAGLTHIGAVLLAPGHARDLAFTNINFSMANGKLSRVDSGNTNADLDPAFINAVCRFDGDTGPIRLTGTMPATYWSIAAMADDGRILSTTSREDLRGANIDLLVGRTAALDTARQAAGIDSIETMSLPVDTGFLLVRLFAGDLEDRSLSEAAADGLQCQPAFAQ